MTVCSFALTCGGVRWWLAEAEGVFAVINLSSHFPLALSSVLDSASRLDEEHKLIARYAARLAAETSSSVSVLIKGRNFPSVVFQGLGKSREITSDSLMINGLFFPILFIRGCYALIITLLCSPLNPHTNAYNLYTNAVAFK